MLKDARETAREHALLYRMARAGKINLNELRTYSQVLCGHRTILESTQTEDRLGLIEQRLEQMLLADNRNVVQFKKGA
jgi:hypothetical protein